MKLQSRSVTLGFALFSLIAAASARDTVLPAGTLLQCTLNEPNFSSATAEVGDPVLCNLRGITSFGQQAFPRGSYLVGHLESEKDPGHFVGKGYLKLQFDRIGLPSGDLPLQAKVIATAKYKVDKGGRIDGKGHAKRDVAEWLLPPLWPWKVIMLPARGPRPTLKGETVLSLRLMDDVQVPRLSAQLEPGFRHFGRPQNQSYEISNGTSRPRLAVRDDSQAQYTNTGATQFQQVSDATLSRSGSDRTIAKSVRPIFILKTGLVLSLGNYQYQNGRITYTLANGGGGVLNADDVDWTTTTQANNRNGVHMTLHGGHLTQEASAGF